MTARKTMQDILDQRVKIQNGTYVVELLSVNPSKKDENMLFLNFKTEDGIRFSVTLSPNTYITCEAVDKALQFFGVNDLTELESGEFEVTVEWNKNFLNLKEFILE